MQNSIPGIFNDVLGPVMRGPSSSHTAGALRIGQLIRQIFSDKLSAVNVYFDPQGSLATTFHSQGSDFGLIGGLLGMDARDEKLIHSIDIAKEKGLRMHFETRKIGSTHPNLYQVELIGSEKKMLFDALSTGGGMIELIGINDQEVSIKGGEYLLFLDEMEKKQRDTLPDLLRNMPGLDLVLSGKYGFISKASPFEDRELSIFNSRFNSLRKVDPVLALPFPEKVSLPFLSARDMMENLELKDVSFAELAIQYECARTGCSREEVLEKADEIIEVMRASIISGIKGTLHEDRILGQQSHKIDQQAKRLIPDSLLNRIIKYASSIMEVKSSMGLIVAAPTAGSCAALPSALFALADELQLADDRLREGLLAAGLLGVFIARQSTFAAELCGCQAECGSASGMAAAGLVVMMGGTCEEAMNAASMALQNVFGLTCDPVANRVEVPCLGKNILAAGNAVTTANMALADFDSVIPLHEVIDAFHKTGSSLPRELRCTGLGGLSVTETSLRIEKELKLKKESGKR